MKSKSEIRYLLLTFIHMVENQFHTTIKAVRSNNGPEFLMTTIFDSKAIIHQNTCIETPQKNGIVERKHQHILNIARSYFSNHTYQSHSGPMPLFILYI